MSPIFDLHAHAYPDRVAGKAVQFLNDYYHVSCQGDGTFGNLLASARAAGVGYLLVHSVATRPDQMENVNTWLGAHIGVHDYVTVLGFGSVHPGHPGAVAELDRIASLGLRGVKLHPDFQDFDADAPEMDPVYAALEGRMPVLIHAGDPVCDHSAPRRIANVARRFPKLTVIAAHLGGYSRWDEARQALVGLPNVLVDSSSAVAFLPKEEALAAIRAFGAKRVLFGTDYPLTFHADELARLLALGLSPEEEQRILFENAAELFGIKA